ncbi:MAG TPA: hypothetical protein VIK89_13955 [Cytophagaceae bacterium]
MEAIGSTIIKTLVITFVSISFTIAIPCKAIEITKDTNTCEQAIKKEEINYFKWLSIVSIITAGVVWYISPSGIEILKNHQRKLSQILSEIQNNKNDNKNTHTHDKYTEINRIIKEFIQWQK